MAPPLRGEKVCEQPLDVAVRLQHKAVLFGRRSPL